MIVLLELLNLAPIHFLIHFVDGQLCGGMTDEALIAFLCRSQQVDGNFLRVINIVN